MIGMPILCLILLFLVGCASNGNKNNYLLPTGNIDLINNKGAVLLGPVGSFGDAPKAVKQIETNEKDAPLQPLPRKDNDFELKVVEVEKPAYLPKNRISTYDLTAYNYGFAPVTIIIDKNENLLQFLTFDNILPQSFVIPPISDKVLMRFTHKSFNEYSSYSFSNTTIMGDYTANHQSQEHYKFPFGGGLNVFASIPDQITADSYSLNSVIFSMPVGTAILASRKGVVVQIHPEKTLKILHSDSTIATYSHLKKIDQKMFLGKTVSTGEVIGVAGTAEDRKEAYVQITVWRPVPILSESAQSFKLVSFPLEFCTNKKDCSVLKQSKWVSRTTGTSH